MFSNFFIYIYIYNLKLTFPEYWREVFIFIILFLYLLKHFGEPKIDSRV